MTRVDWIALAVVALTAFAGLRRGLVATALSLAGLVAGAVLGARVGPHFLHGGASSPYTPVAGLAGAALGATLLQTLAALGGRLARGGLAVVPPLRALDSIGGLAAGAGFGLVLVWVAGAVILQLPGQTSWRQEVQRSTILDRLNTIAPPRDALRALARFDPFPSIAGPEPPPLAPDASVLAQPAVRAARPSVLRITATACGLGVEGSAWVVRRETVVTAAHVVAGAHGIEVDGLSGHAYAIDRRNDVAVLRVPGLDAPALALAAPHPGEAVAILGYPENGPFDARPARVGATADVFAGGRLREVTALSGLVRHGNSGGPAVDAAGAVEATVFAARVGSQSGYGIPDGPVRSALRRARGPVSTGDCG